jgi:hypothetical protein
MSNPRGARCAGYTLMLIIYITSMWGVPFTLVDIRILNIFYFLIDNDAVRIFLCFIYRGD